VKLFGIGSTIVLDGVTYECTWIDNESVHLRSSAGDKWLSVFLAEMLSLLSLE